MSDETKSGGWWHTLPGVLTAVATMLTAVTGLIVAFSQLGFFKGPTDSVAGSSGPVIETPADATVPNTSLPADRIAGKGSGFRVGTIKTQLAAPHTIDAPMPVTMGTTLSFRTRRKRGDISAFHVARRGEDHPRHATTTEPLHQSEEQTSAA